MIKSEFVQKLTAALNRSHVADAADIIEAYEQHFVFKLADGYSEEEIAAKLGDPDEIATLAAVVFAVCLIVGFILSAASAGSLEFWHEWGWFTTAIDVFPPDVNWAGFMLFGAQCYPALLAATGGLGLQ